MHLRSGRIMSNSKHQSTSEPRPSLEQTIEDLAKNVHNLLDRVGQIEASQRERPLTMKEITCLDKITTVTLIRLQTLNMITIITMTLGILTMGCFDCCLGPWVFIDWLCQMDKFFDYYHWAENKKVRYARIKLIRIADLFWEDLEDTLRGQHEPPITYWLEMMGALSRNYLPSTYRSSLLEEWDCLKQGTAPVAEYIEKFKEFKR